MSDLPVLKASAGSGQRKEGGELREGQGLVGDGLMVARRKAGPWLEQPFILQ